MQAGGKTNWMIIERPGRIRLLIEAYFQTRSEAEALVPAWGGRVGRILKIDETQKPGPPIHVSANLKLVREKRARSARKNSLYIPYGMAFGSGEHATTLMLSRALARRSDLPQTTLLDLGTGSGVLALIARKLGTRKIMATDFDPDAIRTARQNESQNFSSPLVRWECADVKKLRARAAHSLIVANLFSNILCEAASPIVRALRKDGELWLSGILRHQQEEVAAAYRAAGLRLLKTTTRGKWVMQQWER